MVILGKLKSNFGMPLIAQLDNGVLEVFLTQLFQFTLRSYQTPNRSIRIYSSRLNAFWSAIFADNYIFSQECQEWLNNIFNQLIQANLDESLHG